MIYAVIALGVLCLVLAYTAWSYRRYLRTWYRLANNSRILVSYNGRVQLQAPLSEWMKWSQMLDKDEMSSGRVVYRNAKFILRLAGERGVRRVDPPRVEAKG